MCLIFIIFTQFSPGALGHIGANPNAPGLIIFQKSHVRSQPNWQKTEINAK